MKLHEYQAKQIVSETDGGVPIPDGQMADNAGKAVAAYREIGAEVCVVKAQIHAGGRGKGKLFDPGSFDPNFVQIDERGVPSIKPGAPAGMKIVLDSGVKLCRSAQEVSDATHKLIGNILVTKQTGPEGRLVNSVLVEAASQIAKEFYLAFTVDRGNQRVVLMASAEGGMEIEQIAAEKPEAILREWFLPHVGMFPYQARKIAYRLGLTEPKHVNNMVKLLLAAASVVGRIDAAMFEINPCVLTQDGQVLALDCKLILDDNALFRHPELAQMRDPNEEDPAETRAAQAEISYVKMEGDIGCLVNGAGLAMSTMDIIKYHGKGRHAPANFLDVGGGANEEKVKTAFEIILSDKNVKAILINIFGGIARCDVIATGVIAACKSIGLKVPLVVRLEGNRKEEGKQLLATSGLNIVPADGMTDAAQKVVAAVDAAKA